MITNIRNKYHLSSARIIPLGFLLLITIGTILLLLPISSTSKVTFIEALFTATTSSCVTGLVVVPTYTSWSLFGKIVILLLIQIGGLGIISVSSLAMIIAKKRFSLSDRLLIMDSFNLDSPKGLIIFLKRVLRGTLVIELLGAIGYSFSFIPKFGLIRGLWYSIFTSISAFCNAGIDILGSDSLNQYNNDPIIMITTMLLIFLGGIGYIVWFDIITTGRRLFDRKLSLRRLWTNLQEHTKVVLILSLSLLLLGASLVLLIEYNNPLTIGDMTLSSKIMNAFFESSTLRTAGFTSFPQENMREGTSLIAIILMFIGGSPMGTAGGVKTLTVYLLLINSITYIRNRKDTILMNRSVSDLLIKRASAIVSFSFCLTLIFTIIISTTNKLPVISSLFEVTSAVATVGLSHNITSSLNLIGKIVIIVAMYLGRIGPISIALFFLGTNQKQLEVHPAKGNFFIG